MSLPVDSLPSSSPPGSAGSPSSAAQTYRPLTPFALVGLTFALLSLLVFVFQKGWVLLFFAAPGLLISLLARRRVRVSEGTLAGAGLANVAIAVCLVSLLGWTTNYVVKYWVIRTESKRFVEEFLENLRADPEGKRAFLATLPPIARSLPFDLDLPDSATRLRRHFSGPEGGASSVYDAFRRDRLWASLLRYGERVQWEPHGVGDWRYDQSRGSYHVEHRYLIKTPELEADMVIAVTSEMVHEGGTLRRDWRIDGPGPQGARYVTEPVRTEYGRRLGEAFSSANQGLMYWMHSIIMGDKEKARAMVVSDKPDPFDKLYEAIRGNTPAGQRALGTVKDMIVLKEEQEDKTWAFTLVFVGENEQYEMQFGATIKGDPRGKHDEWRIHDPKLLVHTKRTAPAGAPGPGMSPGR